MRNDQRWRRAIAEQSQQAEFVGLRSALRDRANGGAVDVDSRRGDPHTDAPLGGVPRNSLS
jgi:hypothetical protein